MGSVCDSFEMAVGFDICQLRILLFVVVSVLAEHLYISNLAILL